MNLEPPAGADLLPCGAPVAEILDQVSAGRAGRYDAHQAGCPHCQAALAEYDRAWAPVREVAATEVRAPEGVLAAALARVRTAAANPAYGVLPGPGGSTRIAARVVVVTARRSAQEVAGVRVALSKLAGDDLAADPEPEGRGDPLTAVQVARPAPGRADEHAPRVVAGVAGESTAIEITLAADYGTDLAALGERIRQRVRERVSAVTGLEPAVVTVHIDDVFD